MDWLKSTTDFTRRDTHAFSFHSYHSFEIVAVKIQLKDQGEVTLEKETLLSENEYTQWIDRCRPSSTHDPHRPTLLLILHRRLEGDFGPRSTSLPYTEESFRKFCKTLCQHRSLAQLILRRSTAVFSSRFVTWGNLDNFGHSTVYHCKSDTSSLTDGQDIVLSATCFVEKPFTFGVMYGCTRNLIDNTLFLVRQCEGSVFHPLLLPIIFAELERKRLLNVMDEKATQLVARILDWEYRAERDMRTEMEQNANPQARNAHDDHTMIEREREAIQLWLSISRLKNGLESMAAELSSMRDHLQTVRGPMPKQSPKGKGVEEMDSEPGIYIDARLKEMIAELQSKIRECEGLLGGMTLVTQMEWNYHTRRDALVNFSIATAMKMDGRQMKQISLLGMIFLPGTFLATFFSMTFFNWIPEGSTQTVSPWLGLYGGITVLLTAGTIMWFRHWAAPDMKDIRESVVNELAQEDDSTLFSRLRTRRAGPTPRPTGSSPGEKRSVAQFL